MKQDTGLILNMLLILGMGISAIVGGAIVIRYTAVGVSKIVRRMRAK